MLYLSPFQMFETYLQFVGIAITNAQIMEASRQEYERNRVICITRLPYLYIPLHHMTQLIRDSAGLRTGPLGF